MLDLTGVKLPFTVGDAVTGAMALVGVVGTFILLGLAFRLAPKFITLFFNSIRSNEKK
ncbi:hypothetical protein [Bacillus mobilis]|uniref:hypothetical protein n=1 Tax=Bacillus mobilis TaxID=2026190 RepID=UPI0021D29CA6|nr:hypothetical protein [Bacillus mobilis]MCU5197932.1 hypothetical protein [Bacillus mobilis]